ncbi:PAS domain-containing sensor histidine kinase [Diaphorobacter sp. HDW4A]|uniref:sensor histidine kinase n=1 Tax=Diaphorobacter sp. HDW4A TaxID=2714924 RepID=UPI001F118E4B|nr:PAS domain-containing sensor histidine kinase [Diaphorobacter sp. HDW4A]
MNLAFWGKDERLRMATPEWCTWFGLDPANVIGHTLAELLPADYLGIWRQHFEGAARGQVTQYVDMRQDKLGTQQWRHVHLSPQLPHFSQPEASGRSDVQGVMMVMTDATREHLREQMLERQREQIQRLQHALEEHRGDGAEVEKLRALLDWRTAMLTEHNEMLQLLSHEIRQPLNNASAAMQATMKAIDDLHLKDTDPATKALSRAEHVLQQVIGTLDNTLAAGTILAVGGKASSSSDTDLPTLIRLVMHDIAADLRPRINEQWDTNTRTVQLHPALMRLTIRNLLNNALSYAPEGSQVTLRISESDDPLALIIEVLDNGPGISDELRPRLFEKGSRGSENRNRAGAGLGLFIVRSVLQLHQGTVEALPNEPQGTIMRLVIPQGLAD